LLVVAGIFIVISVWKQIRLQAPARLFFLIQSCFLALAMLLPIMAGVSTRTSESDRFLHFPSYFLCILIAFIVLHLFKRPVYYLGCFLCILLYQVLFLEKNNLNWDKASNAVRQILTIIAAGKPSEKIYVMNLPDEIDGAFVFRNGFTDALLLNHIDTASVMVASRLTRDEELSVPPLVTGPVNLPIPSGTQVICWNRKKWVRL
jgi:protein O-mannosyl-transferase